MVAVKAHEAAAFLARLDPKVQAVLVYGPDAGLVAERGLAVSRAFAAREKPAGEIVRIDDDVLADDPDRLTVELGTLPMFGGRKVVRATAGRRVDGRALGPLLAGAGPEAWLVVEAGNLLPSSELRALFEKGQATAAVACFGDEAPAIGALIDRIVRDAGMTIEPPAREALAARLGADRGLSRAEIDKLILYAHGRQRIVLDDVEAVVGDASELAFDQVINAVADGRLPAALAGAARLAQAGESAQGLIILLLRHFLRLHRVRMAVDAGQGIDAATRTLRPPLNFKTKPVLEAQVRRWTGAGLTRALELIAAAQLAARTRSDMEEVLAERLLLDLTALLPAARGR